MYAEMKGFLFASLGVIAEVVELSGRATYGSGSGTTSHISHGKVLIHTRLPASTRDIIVLLYNNHT